MGIVIFNGVNSASKHVHVTEAPEYVVPEREYENVHIPGRNGDIIVDMGSYQNVTRSYKMSLDATRNGLDYSKVASAIANWVCPYTDGYMELTDSYDPEHYRLAKYKGSMNISNIFNKAGEFDLEFDCKPQRYLNSGKTAVGAGNVTNPTQQIALPKITISGSSGGTCNISNSGRYFGIKLAANVSNLVVDCYEEDCYNASTLYNQNNLVTFTTGSSFNVTSYEFPKLYPGTNSISVSSGVSVSIVPNWWEL